MSTKKLLSCVAATVISILGMSQLAAAQESRPSNEEISKRLKDQGIQVTPEQIEQGRKIMEDLRNGVQPDPEQFQKMVDLVRKQLNLKMKEALGASDEEWQVIEPRLVKVQNLMIQNGNDQMSSMLSRMGVVNGAKAEQPDVQKKLQALQDLLKNKDAATSDLKAALQAYRDARTKSQAELDAARKDLKEILTARQEGTLVRIGLLE